MSRLHLLGAALYFWHIVAGEGAEAGGVEDAVATTFRYLSSRGDWKGASD
jgi:hypothetical protein